MYLVILEREVNQLRCAQSAAWNAAPQGDAMILFMWQDDIIGVARFIDACLERVYTSAGPPVGDQASDQP